MNKLIQETIDQALTVPVENFVNRQGKRIRSSLLQLSYDMAGGTGELPTAVAESIEWLHAGSLVIDDVQDDSLWRRGQPTMHRVLGIPLAINAGNWMYFRALECLAQAEIPPAQRGELVSAMITASRRCHEGQALDLAAQIDQIPADQWADVALEISTLKTGVLVELAMKLGCVSASATPKLTNAISAFGIQIGIALQMRNDLDELKTARSDSKNHSQVGRSDDLRHGRVTWPWVWYAQLAGQSACRKLTAALGQTPQQSAVCDVAQELFERTFQHGNGLIQSLISEQTRLLGEYVVDEALLTKVRSRLRSIEQAGITTTIPSGVL